MNQDKLKALLKQLEENVERQPGCPDDYKLASYIEGGLSERDHGDFEMHMADCPFCIERIGILGRASESAAALAISEQTRAVSNKRPRWQHASRWASAALVVIAVGFTVNLQSPEEVKNLPPATERYVRQVSFFPEILSPLEGSAVDPDNLVFKWKDVPGSLFYDIRIVSDDGALITRQRVWDTQWLLPAETQLQAGSEYFVRVDAFISEGKAVSSEHTVFKVESTHK